MIFITMQTVIDDHTEIINEYGGLHGILDIGLLASALEMPKSAIYGKYLHPTTFDKAAAYLFHIVCNHPFVDGNKRTGAATCLTFLKLNRIKVRMTKKQKSQFEELIVGTANNEVTKKQIADFLENHSKK